MIHAKLLGGLLSAGVCAGIIGGVTHLVIGGSSNDKPQNNSANLEEDSAEIKQGFFAVAIEESKKDTKLQQKSCSASTDCAVYKMGGSFSLSDDERQKTTITQITTSSEIKTSLQYVLQFDLEKLNNKDQVEVAFSDNTKSLFEIKTSAAITGRKSVKPTLPEGILPKSKLLIPKKGGPSFGDLTKEQKASRKYYTDLYPTFIEREPQKHEDFLVLSWDPLERYEPGKVYWPLENGVMLDKFIFKPMDDQLHDKDDNSEITIDINAKEQDIKAVLEIYEIKNQDVLKSEFASNTTDKNKKFTASGIDWDAIASENVMVTKLTALEYGKFYKFVFKDYKNFIFRGNEELGITNIIIKKVYLEPSVKPPLVHKIFEIDVSDREPSPKLCSYVKSNSKLTYCKWMQVD